METELKYAAPMEVLEDLWQDDDIRQRMTEPIRRLEMHTRYFDTPDRTVRANRWTLRIREENGVSIACCKAAGIRDGAYSSHQEWEVEARTMAEALPKLTDIGAPQELLALDPETLTVTCTAAFTRECAILELGDGCLAELAADLGVLSGQSEVEPLSEIELELKDGPLAPMEDWAKDLADRYGLPPEPRSKLARALALK